LAIEVGFQIHIADEEAASLLTVRDLHQLAIDKLHHPQKNVWEGLCAAIVAAGFPREKIRPET
ncbi:MAG TPA: hypothetical protein VFB63_14775, partial [Bryobacteraceae bacterium]|nr:hypothetical protein [Bryobacteraceae bacterium]